MSAASDATLRTLRWCLVALTVAGLALAGSHVVAEQRQQDTNAAYGQSVMHSPCTRPDGVSS